MLMISKFGALSFILEVYAEYRAGRGMAEAIDFESHTSACLSLMSGQH